MPPRGWRLRIEDILEAIAKIRRYTTGKTFETFARDEKTIDAVVRNLVLIGEATQHVPQDVMSAGQEIPWSKMSAMRHILVHEYFGVSLPIVWETVCHDLPPLVEPLERLLETSE